MKNLSKENLNKLPKLVPEVKPKLQLSQTAQNLRKSDGFTTFNISSKNNTQGGDKGFKKSGKISRDDQVINSTSIKFISNNEPIEVVPSEIIFKDIQTNQTYEITVYIRNLTKISRRIRVYQPQTAKFRADYDMQGAIAAGIAMKLIITFETSVVDKNGFHDVLKIVSDEGFERDIPLHAYIQQASIVFEPFLNLGFVKMNSEKTEKIFFFNEGKIPAQIQLKTSLGQDILIDPPTFSIPPNSQFSVNVTYSPKDAGIFRGLIDVETDSYTLIKQIDVNATSVEFAKFIIDENGSKIDQQDFGTFYFGEIRKFHCYLVNNTPKKYRFNAKFRDGLIYGQNDAASLQTPFQFGKEQTAKVMNCEPAEGVIDCYSQIPITFICNSQVTYKQQISVQNYAIQKDNVETANQDHEDYSYSAIFEFSGEKEDNVIIHVTGRGVCPTVKLAPKNILEFGECSVNDHKDIMFQISNKNKDIPIDFSFPRIPYFHVKPEKAIVRPQETTHFIATFQPKQIEIHQGVLNIELVNKQYYIPLKLVGRCRDVIEKQIIKRGTEMMPQNFEREKKFVTEENFYKKKLKSIDDSAAERLPKWITQTDSQFQMAYEKRLASTEFLKNEREARDKGQKDKLIKKKFEQMSERLKTMGMPTLIEENKDNSTTELGVIKTAPRDFEFEVGMQNRRLDCPKLQLPETRDSLFVKKPIGQYEPLKGDDDVSILKFDPKPDEVIKKKFPSEPKNHVEVRDINATLTGEQLQRIMAGPIQIDFGPVFIRSNKRKTFFIRNDLRSSIVVELFSNAEELQQSYFKTQIIPTSQTGGFDIIVYSPQLKNIRQNIKYVINKKHEFELQILAKIELVKLDLERIPTKMTFPEDNIDLFCTENFKVLNKGNGPAKFTFIHTQSKIFHITPEEGIVPPYGHIDLIMTYSPPPSHGSINASSNVQPTFSVAGTQRPAEEEKITMKVEDGNDVVIKCFGQVPEPKVIPKQQVNLELKEIAVCKPEQREFSIRNTSRFAAFYQVDIAHLPQCTEVTPPKGKLGPDEFRSLIVKFYCAEEKTITGDIKILIRGGKSIIVPFSAKTIIPKINILEEQFDFGNITTLSNSSPLKMTLVNNSAIPVEMILDMREEDENPNAPVGIECLDLTLDQENEESILHSVHLEAEEGGEKPPQQNQHLEELENDALNDSEQSHDENIVQKKTKLFNFNIQPGQQLVFSIKFSPKDTRQYKILVPIQLARYGHLPTMQRFITCKGLNPKFLIEPQIIEYKRKIITTPDKCIPTVQEIMLSNPDRKPMKWWIDVTQLNIDKIFQITPSEGIVQPGSTSTIKASFNPFSPQIFEKVASLYVDDPEISSTSPYVDIVLKGEGLFPRLLFDRKEIILPVVPLNIESSCIFRLINDGYDNLKIRYDIIQDISKIDVELKFLEGKTLGITKNRLKIQAVFKTNKTLSFTTKIEFYDDNGRIYTLPISGTSDNCLFTNFAYFQRCRGEFRLTTSEDNKGPVMLSLEDMDDDLNSVDGGSDVKVNRKKGGHSVVSNKTFSSQGSSKGAVSALGYSPIPSKDLEDSCDFIKRWLNYNVLTQTILSFPTSVMENNGLEIFELITYLIGKAKLPYKANFDGITKRVDRYQKLIKQYEDMIKQLKIEGALLNHIRPEHLLNYQDYQAHIKQLPRNITDYMTQSSQKLSVKQFSYISTDAWITLFYQIMKIYYLSRINSKTFKGIPGIPNEKSNIPPHIELSNVYSSSESILLYWLELLLEQKHKLQIKRLINFDSQFQDGIVIGVAVQSYISNLREIDDMKVSLSSDVDYEQNAEKLLNALRRIGLQTNIKKEDFINPNARQNILFCSQLLHSLPHYIPKSQPIVFACVLGEEVIKYIDLSNSTQNGKPISYYVILEGAPEFTLESEESFVIEPHETYKVKIKFSSRFSEPVTAKITFTNKKESNVAAAALVFELQSNVTGRISVKQWPCSTALYDRKITDLSIVNPFPNTDGDFQITLSCTKIKQDDNRINKQISRKKKKSSNEKSEEVFPAFFCLKDSIKLRKNQPTVLNIIFLPLVLEDQKCFLIFKDKYIGEFQHEIIGKVEEPKIPLDNFKYPSDNSTIFVDEPITVDFPISVSNEQINKARNEIISLISEKSRDKLKSHKNTNSSTNAPLQPEKIIFPGYNLESIIFEVDIQPPNSQIFVPQTFTLTNPRIKAKGLDKDDDKKSKKNEKFEKNDQIDKEGAVVNESQINKFPMNLSFKNPFNGKFTISLKNSLKTDLRKYNISIIATPKPVKISLEFRVPAKNITTQDIPIINTTDKDWPNIKISLTGEYKKNSFMFYVDSKQSKEINVKKKTTEYLHLHFAPKIQCVCEAKLEIFNPITCDKFEYELRGYGEEPVAEDHIVIKCKARETTEYFIEIKNPYNDKEVTYQVETDLLNSVGPSTFTIKAGKTAKYPLKVSPVLSGQYTGSITFNETQEIYIWYTVLLDTESPRATDTIELSTLIRQAVQFRIELQNPLKEMSLFDVIINGMGLVGESSFTVQAESTNVYELVFSPLFVGRHVGSIAFINENLGEIWYDLRLVSEDQPPIRLPVLKTELGKVEAHTVLLENSTDQDVKVTTKIINQTNFDVIPEMIILKAYSQTPVQIRYMPSNLEMTEIGEILFSTQELGKWKYLVFGQGIPPTKFQERIVSAELNKDFSSTIHFKNPFKENICVTVYMEADKESQEIFKLLTKNKKNESKTIMNVPGMNIAQIPFSFVPREINCYFCEIVILMNDKIEWRYPIKGVTESVSNQTSYHFKIQCRNKIEKEMKIFLPGIIHITNVKDEFSYDLEIPQEFENLVRNCFKVKEFKKTLDDAADPLQFFIQFEPLKPFKTSIDLNIYRQAGGRWKFRVMLEATAPKEDDLIVISSPLNRTSSVSFKLTNHKKKTAFFTAAFTPDSDPEFTIMPKQGDMERHGTEGTTFIISFTPVEYGKTLQGKLIIQTDELYWSYQVKGVLPKYSPPECLQSGIDDKHNEQITQIINQKINPRNFMIDNIKKSKISPPKRNNLIEQTQIYQESKIINNIDKSLSFLQKK